jgi:hypothetical protein
MKNIASAPSTSTSTSASAPWWKHGYVWMVVAGPAVVVVASVITFYLAYAGMDTVVDAQYPRKGAEPSQTQGAIPANLAPALQGRNHAATGLRVQPKP